MKIQIQRQMKMSHKKFWLCKQTAKKNGSFTCDVFALLPHPSLMTKREKEIKIYNLNRIIAFAYVLDITLLIKLELKGFDWVKHLHKFIWKLSFWPQRLTTLSDTSFRHLLFCCLEARLDFHTVPRMITDTLSCINI